ncbi:MAG: thiamine pyrophosphate-binding protein [Pseudolysinimonas sp.]
MATTPASASPAPPVSAGTVSASIVAALEPHVSDVFGVMGNGNAWFLDAVVASSLDYTAVRHESAAVAAADAYFRSSGRLAVATTTYGPGFTNALTPLTEAAKARIPLVLVTGDAPEPRRPWDIDQRALTEAAGATYLAVGAADAGEMTRHAIELALAGHGPVVLAIPYHLAAAHGTETDSAGVAASDLAVVDAAPATDAAAISAAAGILDTAEHPVILAGRGAWLAGAQDAAAALASRLGAHTATTALAMSFFGDEPGTGGSLGVAGGFATEATADEIARADVVLVLGASLSQFTMRFGHAFAEDAHVIQVDVADAPTHPRVDTYLRGDAAETAAALLAALDESARRHPHPAPGPVAQTRPDGDDLAPDGRLDPRSLTARLDAILPPDRTVVQDGGHFIGWGPTYLRIPAPDRLLMVGTAFQTIGLGLASAVGAGRAVPESTIVLCTGDGGALMGLADLETVVRSVRRGVIVVFNDAAYGAEIHQYGVRGIDTAPMLIDEVDFAGIAAALGASSAVVCELGDLRALETWLASGVDGVFLADCRVSRTVVAPYMAEVVAAATGHVNTSEPD